MSPASPLMSALFGLAALAMCFFGYRLRKVFYALVGFGIGLTAGFVAGVLLALDLGICLLVGVAVGGVMALLAHKLHVMGMFLMSFGSAFTLCMRYIENDAAAWACALILGAAAGMLTVKYLRPCAILSSSLYGMSASADLLPLFGLEEIWVLVLAGAGLTLLGAVFQFKTNQEQPKAEKQQTK